MPSYQVNFQDLDEEPRRTDITLNILQTSRVIYEEARPLLYKCSTIVFSCSTWAGSKERYISPARLSQTPFENVEIRMDHDMILMAVTVGEGRRILHSFWDMCMNQLAVLKTSRKRLMTITMRLDNEGYNDKVSGCLLEEWHDQPLTESLGKLTDFRSVVIEWHTSCGCVTVRKPSKKYTRQPCSAVAKRIEVPVSPLWEKLGDTLGPKMTEQIILWDKGKWLTTTRAFMRFRNCHVRRWLYRPLAFANGQSPDDTESPDRVRYGYADCNHSFEKLGGH